MAGLDDVVNLCVTGCRCCQGASLRIRIVVGTTESHGHGAPPGGVDISISISISIDLRIDPNVTWSCAVVATLDAALACLVVCNRLVPVLALVPAPCTLPLALVLVNTLV